MEYFSIASVSLALLRYAPCAAQSGAVIPQGGAGHAGQATWVILKRIGLDDQVTSRLYSCGIRGKQFQYVEGKLPDGFSFHGRLADHDRQKPAGEANRPCASRARLALGL